MKNVIIIGSSGMIGSLVLEKCLASHEVRKVTSIVRKPSGFSHPKLNEIVHSNFMDHSTISYQFQQQDIAFYCVGVYTGAVPKDEFRKITVNYTEAFAKTLREQSSRTSFCFLSGQGADLQEKGTMQFARDKGAAENLLIRLKFDQFYSFRPGYIYPTESRKEPNLSYQIMRTLYKPVSLLYPNIGLSSDELATAMVQVGLHGTGKMILENKDIRKIAHH